MNRKGIFLPFLAILTLVLLLAITTAMSIQNNNLKDKGLVGIEATSLYKIYDEAEKFDLYLDLASKQATKETLKILNQHGGYPEDNTCQKSGSYVIWNTCPELNTEESFKQAYKTKLNTHIVKYTSTYKIYNEDLVEPTTNLQQHYTNTLRQATITNIEIKDKIITTFTTLPLPIEHTKGVYQYTPTAITQARDLNAYKMLHLKLSECNSLESCQNSIPEAQIQPSNNLLLIEYNNIKLAFDPSKPLQQLHNPLTL